MELTVILKALVYTIGQGIAFNVVLPLWYLILKIQGIT